MVNLRTNLAISIKFAILIWLGVGSTAGIIVQSLHNHCWKLSSKDSIIESLLLGCPLGVLVSSNVALGWHGMNHRKRFIGTFILSVALALGFFVAAILFFTMVAPTEERWKAKYANGDEHTWLPIEGCLEQSNFCLHFPKVDGCCQNPPHCNNSKKHNSDPDCSYWRFGNHSTCYSCKTCKSAIFRGVKPHGDQTQEALKFFAVAAFFVVVMQVVIFCKGWKDIEMEEFWS